MDNDQPSYDGTRSANTEMEVEEAASTEEQGERANGEEGDEEEEEVETEGEGEGGGEERCEFEFEIGTDPVDLIQGAHDGVELYNRFERLETEAFAERKRKALQDQHQFPDREGPSKKPRQDEFLGATMEEIDEVMNFGFCRRRSRGLV